MSKFRPFSGVRYARGDLSRVLAAPYDVVTPETQQDLIARDRHNVLIIDNPAGGITNEETRTHPYASAAGTLSQWLDQAVLRLDQDPSAYVVSHEFPSTLGGTREIRRGVIGLLPALPWRDGVVLPHENTFRGPKQDRLALMRATQTQTSPIFAMWAGAPEMSGLLDEAMAGQTDAAGDIDGELGSEHLRLWRISDSALSRRLAEAISTATLYIADGHHRYETAVAFAQESQTESPSVLAYLADARDPGMCLLPTHRLVKFAPDSVLPDAESIAGRPRSPWTSEALPADAEPADALAGRSGLHAFVVATRSGTYLFTRPRGATSSPLDGLDVQVLHQELLPAWDVGDSSTLWFERDVASALESVRTGAADVAFLMAPPTVDDVIRVADAGETMPQKSTYFYPKVPTGLVLYCL